MSILRDDANDPIDDANLSAAVVVVYHMLGHKNHFHRALFAATDKELCDSLTRPISAQYCLILMPRELSLPLKTMRDNAQLARVDSASARGNVTPSLP